MHLKSEYKKRKHKLIEDLYKMLQEMMIMNDVTYIVHIFISYNCNLIKMKTKTLK